MATDCATVSIERNQMYIVNFPRPLRSTGFIPNHAAGTGRCMRTATQSLLVYFLRRSAELCLEARSPANEKGAMGAWELGRKRKYAREGDEEESREEK